MASGPDSEIIYDRMPRFREHSFQPVAIIDMATCFLCGLRTHFGTVEFCSDCNAIVHKECQYFVGFPCDLELLKGPIGHHVPDETPMIPPLIVACIKEVESRGMKTENLYRTNSSPHIPRVLTEYFFKMGRVSNISGLNVHAITTTLKKCLISFSGRLIDGLRRDEFLSAGYITDKRKGDEARYQALLKLPKANRETLAFIIIHLQRVSVSPECRMPVIELVHEFAPILVGRERRELSENVNDTEWAYQFVIVDGLLNLRLEYWTKFVDFQSLVPSAQQLTSRRFFPDCPRFRLRPSNFELMESISGAESVVSIRGHKFDPDRVLTLERCSSCGKRLTCGRVALGCRYCTIMIHTTCDDSSLDSCKLAPKKDDRLRLPGTIEAYAPTYPPFIPTLIVDCVTQVESRGRDEENLYAKSTSSEEVLTLLDKLLTKKEATDLSEIDDIHTITSVLKLFLFSLSDSLLSEELGDEFARASTLPYVLEADTALTEALQKLPNANHDTLAFLMIHLNRVSNRAECKMPKERLASVFGSILVDRYTNAEDQIAIVNRLLNLPLVYWTKSINYKTLIINRCDSKRARHRWLTSKDKLMGRRKSEANNDVPAHDEYVGTFY